MRADMNNNYAHRNASVYFSSMYRAIGKVCHFIAQLLLKN
jgi:hypothetical protein